MEESPMVFEHALVNNIARKFCPGTLTEASSPQKSRNGQWIAPTRCDCCKR